MVLPQLTYPATAPEQQQGAASSSNAQAVTRLCEQLTTVKLESEEDFHSAGCIPGYNFGSAGVGRRSWGSVLKKTRSSANHAFCQKEQILSGDGATGRFV